ncbi:Ca2+-binding RTX toxin-like protein [Pararhizobium capsulatum DSM 1112]|uniref:Ca2+-binding RTX toxin-like protein n=1 Tax=Pararhizobium capsulatum DSM 1112 TaxID=1121113 RepID=A0ABU0BZF7_9HYPH|nr:calcium-binding protein [Pararhizobium capsulatum]MDQ0323620.1 Ca2+-binding RTX toxin-like protein [Pararhizobium capsulatum DSM 1112]
MAAYYGNDGDNFVTAFDGYRYFYTGPGQDDIYLNVTAAFGYVEAGPDDDTVWAINGAYGDLYGGSGNDRFILGAGGNNVEGGFGNDYIAAAGGGNFLDGGQGIDAIVGGPGDDVIFGGVGNDSVAIQITAGSDWGIWRTTVSAGLYGGLGSDYIDGGQGNDSLFANDAAMTSDPGIDEMRGGSGNDEYFIANSRDKIFESVGDGTDTVWTNRSYALPMGQEIEFLFIKPANTAVVGINLTGNAFANTIQGNIAANIINGGGGADKMFGGSGNDTYVVDNVGDVVNDGGNDPVDLVKSSISFSLVASAHVVGKVENLTLMGAVAINATGNASSNVITGNTGANILNGAAGNDTINGGGGNDYIYGGAGNDKLTGGAGNDNFVFNTAISAATNVDTILDFNVIQDTIRLDNAVMPGLGSSMVSGEFWKSTSGAAHDTSDHIIYETDTGKLFYDSNGSASGGSTHIATLSANLALTYADLLVI